MQKIPLYKTTVYISSTPVLKQQILAARDFLDLKIVFPLIVKLYLLVSSTVSVKFLHRYQTEILTCVHRQTIFVNVDMKKIDHVYMS